MISSISLSLDSWRDGIRPEPKLSVSEWADRFRVLSEQAAAEHGPWRTSRTPYLREIMDELSPSSPTQIVVLMKGSQIGGTEAGNNFIGFAIAHAPGPMLFVQPSLEMARRTSRQRIAPMIEGCPALKERVREPRSRDSGNTILSKEFPGGMLILTGANSAVGLRSMPARYLVLDEVDAFDDDIDGEGDPIELALRRTATFRSNRKVLIISTPKIRGSSRIERAFAKSDQRFFEVPCPSCGVVDRIRWERIRWPDGEPERAWLVCGSCNAEIDEGSKGWMLERGRWTPTARGGVGIAGFHLSALYSPPGWYSWGDAAVEFVEAKEQGREALQVWVNTVLGETWEEPADSAVDESTLLGRREEYPAEVPAGALVLTAGVDVQDDRLEFEVVGWGPHEGTKGIDSWSIEKRVLHGDPSQDDLWDRLDGELMKTFEHEDGYKIRISTTCIDSGGHFTQKVYRFCRKRQARMIYAIKGMSGLGRPIVSQPSPKRTGRKRRPVKLWIVGVDQAKALLYGDLRQPLGAPGYAHFPKKPAYDEEFFRQLTAEKREPKKYRGRTRYVWVLVHPRNEALDCRVYALAALEILEPNWAERRRRAAARKKEAKSSEPASVPEEEKKPAPRPLVRRRPSNPWVRRFAR